MSDEGIIVLVPYDSETDGAWQNHDLSQMYLNCIYRAVRENLTKKDKDYASGIDRVEEEGREKLIS